MPPGQVAWLVGLVEHRVERVEVERTEAISTASQHGAADGRADPEQPLVARAADAALSLTFAEVAPRTEELDGRGAQAAELCGATRC